MAHQVMFLPRIHVFKRMVDADVYLLADDLKFGPDWQRRTLIKTPQGVEYLRVTLSGSRERPIREVMLHPGDKWRAEFMKTVEHAYSRATYGAIVYEMLKEQLFAHQTLYELNKSLLIRLRNLLDVDTTFVEQSESPGEGLRRLDRVLQLTRQIGGTGLLASKEAYRDIKDVDERFRRNGIRLVRQDWAVPEYPQLWGGFVPGLSVIDALANTGIDGTRRILGLEEKP